jgi:hypothetical protein
VYPPENESPQKILNNALVPDDHEEYEQKNHDDKKNKYALKMNDSEPRHAPSKVKKTTPQP